MERMAWRSSTKFERGVVCEKGAVAKKAVFSLTNIADRKWAFNLTTGGILGGYQGTLVGDEANP